MQTSETSWTESIANYVCRPLCTWIWTIFLAAHNKLCSPSEGLLKLIRGNGQTLRFYAGLLSVKGTFGTKNIGFWGSCKTKLRTTNKIFTIIWLSENSPKWQATLLFHDSSPWQRRHWQYPGLHEASMAGYIAAFEGLFAVYTSALCMNFQCAHVLFFYIMTYTNIMHILSSILK